MNINTRITPSSNKTHLMKDELIAVKYKSSEEQGEVLADILYRMGVKDEHMNQNFFHKLTNKTPFYNGELKSPFGKNFALKDSVSNALLSQSNNVKLANEGDPWLQQTSAITGLIEYITPELGLYSLPELVRETSYNQELLALDVMYPNTGVIHQKAGLDDLPTKVPARTVITQTVTPGAFQEYASFRQQTALFTRQYGGDVDVRGFSIILAKTNELLAHRADAGIIMNILTSIKNGYSTYYNEQVSLGIPTANLIDFIDYVSAGGGYFGNINTTSGYLEPSSDTVFPMLDILNVLKMVLYRYNGMEINICLNSRTHSLWNQHPNITSYTQYLNANTSVVNGGTGTVNTLEAVIKYLLPQAAAKINVVVHDGSYIPDSNDPYGNSANAPTDVNPYGNAVPVFPDGYMYIYPTVKKEGGGSMFEWAYTLAPQNGGMLNPKAGRYYMMIDSLASNTLLGVANPEFYLLSGFNAVLRPIRQMDMFVVKCATVNGV